MINLTPSKLLILDNSFLNNISFYKVIWKYWYLCSNCKKSTTLWIEINYIYWPAVLSYNIGGNWWHFFSFTFCNLDFKYQFRTLNSNRSPFFKHWQSWNFTNWIELEQHYYDNLSNSILDPELDIKMYKFFRDERTNDTIFLLPKLHLLLF